MNTPLKLQNLDLWVLAGQSNMVGRAPLKGALPPHKRVWSLASNGTWELASDPLHRLWESYTPVHQEMMRSGMDEEKRRLANEHWAALERQSNTGAGLGLAFGAALTEAHGRSIGLIPCAQGGAALNWWEPGFAVAGGQNLYRAMLDRIHRAQEAGQLTGLLWYQGETDALSLTDAELYAERLGDWISQLRSDTGIASLPVLFVQPGRVFESQPRQYPGIDLVRHALADLPRQVSRTAVTSAIDLPLCDDCHIGTSGLIRLGRRLARLALRLIDQPETPGGPSVDAVSSISGQVHRLRLVLGGVTGRLHPSENMSGFSLHNDPSLQIWNADVEDDVPCPLHGASIRLLVNRKPAAAACLAYGQGPHAYCNVVDEADMPLCAFAPQRISDQ